MRFWSPGHGGLSRRQFVRAAATYGIGVWAVTAAPARGAPRQVMWDRSGTRLAVLPAGPAPVPAPFPFSHVGVCWRGSEHAAIEIRTGAPDRLGPWRRLPVAHDLGDHDTGLRLSGLLRADGATAVHARVEGDARALEVVVIDATGVPMGMEAGGHPPAPPIVSRAGWGADDGMRRGTPQFAPLSKLVVHHTVTPNDDPDPASTVRAIYAFHTRQRGWNDIGYNFLVDAAGRVYEGRYARSYGEGETPSGEDSEGRGVIGAHARGHNTGSVGVALLGDFSRAAEPTGPALDSLVQLLAWKAARHDIDPHGSSTYTRSDGSTVSFPNLSGHRDVGTTACPGDRLYQRLPEVRDRVAAAMRTAPAPVPPPLPPLPGIPGLWTVSAEGRVRAHGDAPTHGDVAGVGLAAPVVGLTPTPTGNGYWLLGADGGVFAFGDAPFLGSAAGQLSDAAVELEPTPSGAGYWVLSARGELLAFGDALFLGATAPLPIEVAGLAATPTGQGYWVAASDGRVFAFGDALTRGVTGGRAVLAAAGETRPTAPIVAITAHPDGRGYWLLGADGQVLASDVGVYGRMAGDTEAVRLRATPTGEGYFVAGADGAMFPFGDADRRWELPATDAAGVADFGLRRTHPSEQAMIL